jgi:hypothetical protein
MPEFYQHNLREQVNLKKKALLNVIPIWVRENFRKLDKKYKYDPFYDPIFSIRAILRCALLL